MPIITVETNLKYEQLAEGFGPALSKFTSETLNKPEEVRTVLFLAYIIGFSLLISSNIKRITVSLVTDRRMWRNGNDSPMMQILVSAIGAVSTAEQNTIHTRRFTDFIMEKTGLPIER